MAKNTSTRLKELPGWPANAYGEDNSEPFARIRLEAADRALLREKLRLSAKQVRALLAADKRKRVLRPNDLQKITGLSRAARQTLEHRLLFDDDRNIYIDDVTVEEGYVFSDRPFRVQVQFTNPGEKPAALAAVTVSWAGQPFTVEKKLTEEEAQQGMAVVEFDGKSTLPVGHAQFLVALYRADGAQASFQKSYWVLPSNPLSLTLSPAGATVTGTWSARGEYIGTGDRFVTSVTVTIANGDSSAVSLNRTGNWEFWDGGVGSGTRIEAGTLDWGGIVTVPAYSIWRGSVSFSSPNGSGVYNVYRRKEDMALQIQMTATDGRSPAGQITCRVMVAFGVNIIKVGNFGAQEHVDLYNAVDQMRQIFERRDVTLRGVGRYIINNSLAGGYTILDSEDEFRDMLEDWSVPNDWIDVYVVQQFNWSGFNGYAGNIPGPTGKTGREDGVAGDKTGFTDGNGTARLNTGVLSQLIGHEVGHFLGLSHVSASNNLMLANTGVRGPDLAYDQYRTMFAHGFMVFI
jgi:hypothetical protein